MIKTYSKLIAVLSILCPLSLFAQVNDAQIIPFQAGTPATAADMNQNIDELTRAINENTAQLQALQEQMSIIASVINLAEPTLQENLSGSVYKLGILEIGHGVSDVLAGEYRTQLMRDSIWGESGTLTLNANNTASLVLNGQQSEALLNLGSGVPAADPSAETPSYGDVSLSSFPPESETIAGTWSLAGNVLSVVLGIDTQTFNVSIDGNTLLHTFTDSEPDGTMTVRYAGMDLGIRISKPQPNIEVEIDADVFENPDWNVIPILATNSGAPHSIFDGPGSGSQSGIESFRASAASNGRKIYIKNTGTSDLTLGSSALQQTQGGGLSLQNQGGPITIAPNTEFELTITDTVFDETAVTATDLGAIYLMTNDPDTPTFIVNISSR
ncbi:MAG: hypothetical protein ACSHX4_03830 [Opitutaceae bacterium]